jgi:hypothetical protein
MCSEKTLYNYVDACLFDIRSIDLPSDICDELAMEYFNGNMPEELQACLEDRCSSAICCEIANEEAVFRDAASDAEKYLSGSFRPTVRTPYQRLRDDYSELQDFQLRRSVNFVQVKKSWTICAILSVIWAWTKSINTSKKTHGLNHTTAARWTTTRYK